MVYVITVDAKVKVFKSYKYGNAKWWWYHKVLYCGYYENKYMLKYLHFFYIHRAIYFWKIIPDFSEWHVVGMKFSTVEFMSTSQWGMQVSEINEMKKKSYEILVNKLNNKLFNLNWRL